MVHNVSILHGCTIGATDGEIGRVDTCLFDDQRWTVRYLVVDTGGWLSGRRVLISPIAVEETRWDQQLVRVDLTRRQVEHSPDIATDLPVSRQHELAYFGYYGYPPYWVGSGLWGGGLYPGALAYPVPAVPLTAVPPTAAPAEPLAATEQEQGDPHLRSTREVIGYAIATTDGEIGHVEDFVLDDATWTLRYLVVDTRNWWPGKHVLVAPRWISEVSWPASAVRVDLPRAAIKGAPAYDPSVPLDRTYEERLHAHYRRAPYWEAERGS